MFKVIYAAFAAVSICAAQASAIYFLPSPAFSKSCTAASPCLRDSSLVVIKNETKEILYVAVKYLHVKGYTTTDYFRVHPGERYETVRTKNRFIITAARSMRPGAHLEWKPTVVDMGEEFNTHVVTFQVTPGMRFMYRLRTV
jgi:hypothetical protein